MKLRRKVAEEKNTRAGLLHTLVSIIKYSIYYYKTSPMATILAPSYNLNLLPE